MERVSNELYLFLFAALGMIGCIILIANGHNSYIEIMFLTLNGIGGGLGGVKMYKSRKAVKTDGKEKD